MTAPPDASPAAWLSSRLGEFGTVGGLVPTGFDRYVLCLNDIHLRMEQQARAVPSWTGDVSLRLPGCLSSKPARRDDWYTSGPLTPTPAQPTTCGQRHKHTQGQPQAASDCFSPKKDGNTADHRHHSSHHRRTPLLERKEHRHSIAFSTSFTPVIPGGCTHRQRQAAKYNEATESTSKSWQGHVRSTLPKAQA